MRVLACKDSSFRAEPLSKLSDTPVRKDQKSERWKALTEVLDKHGGQTGDGGGREKTESARRRQRRVCESFCGDGECASSWQTNKRFAALFSIDEHVWSLR
eukprot:1992567-Pleurochrysis_carterae.AAC.1